jgi:hypothetical protein
MRTPTVEAHADARISYVALAHRLAHHGSRSPAQKTCKSRKAPAERGLSDAAEWSRTITGVSTHKALNLARLPVPPQPQEGAILDVRGRGESLPCKHPGEAVACEQVFERFRAYS